MNEIKYSLLKYLDESDHPISEADFLNGFKKEHDAEAKAIKKHIKDLIFYNCIICDSSSYSAKYQITAEGRKYMEDFKYRKEFDDLYKKQLNDSLKYNSFSRKMAWASFFISLISLFDALYVAFH